jgi:hypothetical protein
LFDAAWQEGACLLALLRRRWGDEPGWILRPYKDYGFFLYRRDLVPIGDVRSLIENTFGFATGPSFIKQFDKIILSTLPHTGSRWLRQDLPAKLKKLGLPVTHVVAG